MATPPPRTELVHAYLFSSDGVGRRVDADAALAWLNATPRSSTEFLWLHFSSPHGISKNWLRHIDLADTFREVLQEERRSSRVSHVQLGLFAVLNEVDYEPARRTQTSSSTLWLSLRERWLLSAWNGPMQSVQQLADDVDAAQRFRTPLALVVELMNHQSSRLANILRDISESANRVERTLDRDRLPRRASLGGYRRDLMRLQRLLAPDPDSLVQVLNRPPRWASEEDLDTLHLATENFLVVVRDLESLQGRITLLVEEIAARVAERTNRSVFVLTAVTVIALPATVIGTVFGMNVGGMPMRGAPYGFSVVLAVSGLLTIVASWWIARLLKD